MLQINDKLRIRRSDDKNLVIEEYNDKIVNPRTKEITSGWQWCGYYGDLKTALNGVLKKELMDSVKEELQIKDIITRIEKVENDIKNMKEIEVKEDK